MPIHDNPGIEKQYLFSIALTTLILIVEGIGGFWTGSLALLSDAGHVLTDIFALGLSYLAFKLSSRPPDEKHTYGFHRLEVLAALTNGLTLGLISIGILTEAWSRWNNPQPIKSVEMMVIAVAGLVVNLAVAFLLHSHEEGEGVHHEDLNKKSAYLHVIGDAISSVGVIIAAALIWFTGYQLFDPLISAAIACMIAAGSFRVLKSSLHILVEGVPEGLSLSMVQKTIRETPGITDVHDLHIWNICSGHIALSAHVVMPDQENAGSDRMLILKKSLSTNFGIEHTTIQVEKVACSNDLNSC
jgi:cobalt-zinc-cadmium efflux system protein